MDTKSQNALRQEIAYECSRNCCFQRKEYGCCYCHPLGVVIAKPFEVNHAENELRKLARFLKRVSGDTKVIMESTGNYNIQVADNLHDEGIFVAVVNPILIANYDANITVRKSIKKNQ